MPDREEIILGEFRCTVDERYRVSIPGGLLPVDSPRCVLVKERPGCLSLWRAEAWQSKVAVRIDLARQKIEAGLRDDQIGRVQLLGRLLSTGHQGGGVGG